jgi:hypothetical protein
MKVNDRVMAPSPFYGETDIIEGIVKGVREYEVDVQFTHEKHGTFTFNCKKINVLEESSKLADN